MLLSLNQKRKRISNHKYRLKHKLVKKRQLMWRKQKWNKEWEQNNKNAIVPLYSLEQIKEQLS